MSYLDVLLGGYKTIQNNGSNVAAEPTLNIVGATSIVDDSANKRTTVTLGTGITQLTGDATAGPGSGSVASTVVKANGASVPAAGSLTTGNVLQVSGASALSYGPVNLAGGANYISGTLPAGNQAAQTMGGEVTGTTAAAVVSGPFSTASLAWTTGTSAASLGTNKSGATFSLKAGAANTALTVDGTNNNETYLFPTVGGTIRIGSFWSAGLPNAGYGGVYFGSAVSAPDNTNFTLLMNASLTTLNAPSGGTLNLGTGGGTAISITSSITTNLSLVLGAASVQFAQAVSSPTINQAAASGAAATMSITAQAAGGTNDGGALALAGGAHAGASKADGSVKINTPLNPGLYSATLAGGTTTLTNAQSNANVFILTSTGGAAYQANLLREYADTSMIFVRNNSAGILTVAYIGATSTVTVAAGTGALIISDGTNLQVIGHMT